MEAKASISLKKTQAAESVPEHKLLVETSHQQSDGLERDEPAQAATGMSLAFHLVVDSRDRRAMAIIPPFLAN